MSHDRRHATLSILIAVIGVSVLALTLPHWPRLVPRRPLSQRVPELEDDPRGQRAEAEAAIEWRVMRMRDENGQIPDGALMGATEQMHAMRAAQARQSRFSAASTISWTSIGPTNVGGRVRSIAIHPNDAGTIFAGSVGGGIWKTTDGGGSWSPVNDFMANLAVTSIVFTPTNPAVMYAATGEGLAGSIGIRGAGVFKSTDGGATWNQLSSTANANFYFVNRVAVSPDGTTLIAAAATGIYRSTDGGATFPAATLGGSLGEGVAQVVFDPNNSSKAVAGAFKSKTNAALSTPAWYSSDGGANWTPVPVPNLPDAARVELAYARSVANKVYASVNSQRGLIYVSTNGGQSFTLATSGSPQFLGGQGSWANALWVDPTNDQLLVVGGTDLYRSTNGGSTFTQVSGLIPGVSYTTHVDNHAIVSAPNYDGTTVKTVFLGNDGGVYKAADITTATTSSGWTDMNNGLAVTQFYSVATNAATGSIVGGTQDNATLRTSGSGTTWSGAHGSDGGFVAHDPVNTNYYYFSMLGLRVFRNENDGKDFGPEITGYWCDNSGCRCKSGALGALCQDWIVGHANALPPVVLDPNNPDRLLVGADHLFVTTDPRTEEGQDITPTASGPSWFMIKPSTGQYISAVAVSPTSSNIIAVGHNDGAVYVTTNGTNASPTWTKVDDNATALPDRMVTSITLSAANPNTLWVTFGGYNSQNIWKSTNLGGNWLPINGSGTTALPPAPIYDLKFLSTNENSLYLATEIGLFTSADGGAHWLPQQGPANVSVEQLAWLGPTTLVAATHGRGMFKATVGGSPTGVTVAGIVPTSGSTAGGLAVTIIGANFVSGATVTIGGVAATNVTLENATTITATTAAHAAGLVNVVVTNPDTQTGTLVNGFTYTSVSTMSLDKASLVFSAVSSGAAFSAQTSAQTIRLTQTGAGPVTWTAASTTPWLVVSPTSGSGSATLTIATQFASGLTASQTGSVTLTFTGAGNTAGPINVTLNTSFAATAPVGSFDTPTDGTTGVTGSIAVTGWAMDDVEVTGIRILRDPVAGEPPGALVLLGNAVLVDGARPDVQAGFPNSPRNTRAGWGYLMLTNFLPGLGNGTVKLTAIADDADGHSTVLGTKTITCTNSTATTPTGAIDTPAQGGTVSGNVVNFGWVLSASPGRADPPSGGAVRVVIDGAFSSAVPSGWTSRSDLSGLFPAAQYPGIVNALGVAVFDSTPLANGVHTISWLVTDNLGAASGIGSRYFTVSNGSLMLDPDAFRLTAFAEATAVKKAEATGGDSSGAPPLSRDSWLPPLGGSLAGGSLSGRRGFDLDAAYRHYRADEDGRITVQAEELDRIELQLGSATGQSDAGYLRIADALAPLPIGSVLNASTGAFTWAPGVGFVGTYDLVFVRSADGQAVARQEVRIVLNPKGSNRVGPQTIIDLPAKAGSHEASSVTSRDSIVVGSSFVLAGWAADLRSTVDRGVDAIHVWAYPAAGDDPVWIGAATYGGRRPDVAAIYGDRFVETGYGLTVHGLAPGTYDLAVFAYSSVTGGFLPAKTVRITVR